MKYALVHGEGIATEMRFAPGMRACRGRRGLFGAIVNGRFRVYVIPREIVDGGGGVSRLRGGGPGDEVSSGDDDDDSDDEDWEKVAQENRETARARNDAFSAKSGLLAYRAKCDLSSEKMPKHARALGSRPWCGIVPHDSTR